MIHSKLLASSLTTGMLLALATRLPAADTGFAIEKTPTGGLSIKVGGQPFADYVVDQGNKPFLAPVFGPTGKQMTRSYPMKTVEGEQHDHPHHRGICFGNEDIGGVETWAEKATFEEQEAKKPGSSKGRLNDVGTIKHREYKQIKAEGNAATVVVIDDVINHDGKKVCEEEHTMTFRADAETRTIDFDLDYIASEGPLKIGDKKDAGFSIRVPTSMAVDSKLGGKLINSEGVTNTDAWGKRAKWCDYNGPVEGENLGVAMLNHPSSFRFPTPWHIRTYGLFTANPFGLKSLDKAAEDGTIELKKGERIKLRHRLIFHKGDEKTAKIAEAWEAYAKEAK